MNTVPYVIGWATLTGVVFMSILLPYDQNIDERYTIAQGVIGGGAAVTLGLSGLSNLSLRRLNNIVVLYGDPEDIVNRRIKLIGDIRTYNRTAILLGGTVGFVNGVHQLVRNGPKANPRTMLGTAGKIALGPAGALIAYDYFSGVGGRLNPSLIGTGLGVLGLVAIAIAEDPAKQFFWTMPYNSTQGAVSYSNV